MGQGEAWPDCCGLYCHRTAHLQDAVSVALGGVVPRSDLAHLSVDAGLASERLLLEDPLTGMTGEVF
jgi:hypothetical protein